MSFFEDLKDYPDSLLKRFTQYPQKARLGLIFLFLGWCWFCFTLYIILEEIPNRILITGIGLCVSVFIGYNWARVLCILCNILAVIYGSFFAFYLWGLGRLTDAALLSVGVVIFGYCSYFLIAKETSDYFKLINKKD